MTVEKSVNGTTVILALEGRLDTTTAPQLDSELENICDGAAVLIFDFKKLDYISSAGLRILLLAQKRMNKQGKMIVRNVNKTIRDVFEITGFADILTVE